MTIYHPILRRSVAGILLVLFAFSTMPKKLLHDWIVNHKDGVVVKKSAGADEISKAGFNCNIQNLVAESPFTSDSASITFDVPLVYNPVAGSFSSQVHSAAVFFYSLRGPPSVIS